MINFLTAFILAVIMFILFTIQDESGSEIVGFFAGIFLVGVIIFVGMGLVWLKAKRKQ